MNTLREEFEALMPEPVGSIVKRVNLATRRTSIGPELHDQHKDLPPRTDLYTADQVREAMKAVAERCAVLVETCPPPRKLEGGRIEIGECARNAFAAAIRAQAGGDHE